MMEFIGYWVCVSLGLALCLFVTLMTAFILMEACKSSLDTLRLRKGDAYEWERTQDGRKVKVYFRGFRWRKWNFGVCSTEMDDEEE